MRTAPKTRGKTAGNSGGKKENSFASYARGHVIKKTRFRRSRTAMALLGSAPEDLHDFITVPPDALHDIVVG
jgi:hypothetical protein